MFEELLKFGEQLLQWLRWLNAFIIENFGGILILIIAVGVIVAIKRIGKEHRDRESVKQLAEAIVRQYNKEMRSEK